MIKVCPYILTSGSNAFKEFLSSPFDTDMLYSVYDNITSETLFEGWKGKDMNSWYRFINDEKYVLEFYPTRYFITHEVDSSDASIEAMKHSLLLPRDIDDFINDMHRFKISLYWSDWINKNFEPKDYLEEGQVKQYYVNLLGKLDKSYELQ
jgi:hypothetical protein